MSTVEVRLMLKQEISNALSSQAVRCICTYCRNFTTPSLPLLLSLERYLQLAELDRAPSKRSISRW